MKKIIDKNLLEWILSIDDTDQIYAQNYGSFSLEKMDFNIFITDEEFKKYNEAEKAIINNNNIPPTKEIGYNYYKPIQAHNHELIHFYQALSLPAFNIYQKLTKRLIEFEAAIMLKYFESGYSYTLKKNTKILEALKNPEFNLPETETSLNKLISNYRFYKEQWASKYKDISLFYIIEGMSHIMSIQLTPDSSNYLAGMENHTEYNIAYNIFSSCIDVEYKDINIRIKHLIFLYICYFSCQIYSLPEDKILKKSSRLFYVLSKKINLYIKAFIELIGRYKSLSENRLKQLNQFQINKDDIKISNKNQLCII